MGIKDKDRTMKDEPQIFTRTDMQGTPVELDVLKVLEDVSITESLLRQYIHEAFAIQDKIANIHSPRILSSALPPASSFSSHIFEESYVTGVLGIQIPLNESHPYSPNLQSKIIEEQLVLEGWFGDFKKVGGDMKNMALSLRYMFEDPSRVQSFVSTSFDTIIKEPITKIVEFIKGMIEKVSGWFSKFEFGKKIAALWEKTKSFLNSLKEKLETAWTKVKGLAGWKQALGVIALGTAIGYLWKEKGWGDIIDDVGKKIDAVNEVILKWGQKVAKTVKKGAISLAKKPNLKKEMYAVPPLASLLYEDDERLHEFLGGIFGKKNKDAKQMGLELSKGTPAPEDGILISPEQAKNAKIEPKSEDEAKDELENVKGQAKDAATDELKDAASELGSMEEVQVMREEIITAAKPLFDQFQEIFLNAAKGILQKVGIEAISSLVTGGVGTFLKGLKNAYGGVKLISDLFGDSLGSFVKKIENPEEETKEAESGKGDPTDANAQKAESLIRAYVRNKLLNENKLSGRTIEGILDLLDGYASNTWIFFDTETTGMHPGAAQLTEIGAIAIDPKTWDSTASVLGQFNEKISFTPETEKLMNDPDSEERKEWEKKNQQSRRPLNKPQDVLAMTRYGEKGRSYGEEQDTLEQFFEWADGFPNPLFVAQNASFDLKFLNVRSGGKLPKYPVLDTMQLMQYYLIPLLKTQSKAEEGDPEAQELLNKLYIKRGNWGYHSSSMGVVSKAYGINIDDWHNALADVKMMMEMYRNVVNTIRKGLGTDISKEQGKVLSRQKKRKKKR